MDNDEKAKDSEDHAQDGQTELQPEPQPEPQRDGIGGLQVIQSTIAAALGVQSSKNRKRDFAEGRASQFIIAGVLFTAIFVGVMVLIVRTVLS